MRIVARLFDAFVFSANESDPEESREKAAIVRAIVREFRRYIKFTYMS
jgi:hypothetical protein